MMTVTPLVPTEQIQELIASLLSRCEKSDERIMIGIVGAPGSGKSTLAEYVLGQLPEGHGVVVPMDGFHLANCIIEGTELQARKGAIDTFDSYGYVSLLKRIRNRDEPVVYAPEYRREIEEPVASAIAISQDIKIVITEGNYLLSPSEPWGEIPEILDETWFVEVDHSVRLERLVARHVKFGKPLEKAIEWANTSDETNALEIAETQLEADVTVRIH
jgi:pantothenate kinase